MHSGDDAVIDLEGLDRLFVLLGERGYRTIGPIARDGAIVHGEVAGVSDLPAGWHDIQAPGRYRIEQGGDPELFGWAVGPASWKSEFFRPAETVWRASVTDGVLSVQVPPLPERPVAIVGARPCELAALDVLDRVLARGRCPRRPATRLAAPGRSSSPWSAESRPAPASARQWTPVPMLAGYDLALTELLVGRHRFYVRVGSEAGAELLEQLDRIAATEDDRRARQDVVDGARAGMGRSLETEGLAELLGRNLEHPRWEEVAERCLSCGNCTLVCPTCFCVGRQGRDRGRRHRRAHEGRGPPASTSSTPICTAGQSGPPPRSRYRQWLTHKLSTWWDQFDTSGCVGCGRCIAWCPVGIDITEEAAAIRATDGALDVR